MEMTGDARSVVFLHLLVCFLQVLVQRLLLWLAGLQDHLYFPFAPHCWVFSGSDELYLTCFLRQVLFLVSPSWITHRWQARRAKHCARRCCCLLWVVPRLDGELVVYFLPVQVIILKLASFMPLLHA